MAPELAIEGLRGLPPNSLVLDPMVGSGTVARHAVEHGHRALGYDLDPLAVLIARVWTTPIDEDALDRVCRRVRTIASGKRAGAVLPWMDQDEETLRFSEYWFGDPQRSALRRLAHALHRMRTAADDARTRAAVDVLQVALSRIIITKDRGASLARDVSHSRPHKTFDSSEFDVMAAFESSTATIRRLLLLHPPRRRGARIKTGDARNLQGVRGGTVDAVVTSPPYLNAIDYMRGHRLSLVWLGYCLRELRSIRSEAIGAERAPDRAPAKHVAAVRGALGSTVLPSRHEGMVTRYSLDIYAMMSEIARVLKPQGRAILVVGNSCLKESFIHNSAGVAHAASLVGLRMRSSIERELPSQHRYLPLPDNNALGKRMRTEAILSFERE
jgi:hypothetical protein